MVIDKNEGSLIELFENKNMTNESNLWQESYDKIVILYEIHFGNLTSFSIWDKKPCGQSMKWLQTVSLSNLVKTSKSNHQPFNVWVIVGIVAAASIIIGLLIITAIYMFPLFPVANVQSAIIQSPQSFQVHESPIYVPNKMEYYNPFYKGQ